MATFTLTGTLLHDDGVTPVANSGINVKAAPYPDPTLKVLYTRGVNFATDANGAFSKSLVTATGLYYTIRSTARTPLFQPIVFAAPAAGVTVDLSALTAYDPTGYIPNVYLDTIAAKNAAVAAAAGVQTNNWAATTAYVVGQVVRAPDGSTITSNSSRTSRATFDATEQALWVTVSANSGTLENRARAAAEWSRAPRVSDLAFPIIIAHRGAADLEAENTTQAYRNAVGLGFQAVECGDVDTLSDGTLVVMHDSTVDRTTNGTGNVNTFTKATWAALRVDYGTQWGGAYKAEAPPTWEDALLSMAGKVVVVPEVKDQLDATATAMCDLLDALGARDSAIIQSFNPTNLAIASGRGYKTLYLGSTATGMLGALSAARTAGVWSVGLDYTQADVTQANVAKIQDAGFRVFLYTPVHQKDTAAALATGCDGLFTNEPPSWAQSNTAGYRKTATNFHMTGRWEPGMLASGDGSYQPGASGTRGVFLGSTPGAYRISLNAGGTQRGMTLGSLCPVANAAGTYTISMSFVVDTIPTTTTQGPGFYAAMPDDSTAGVTDMANSYLVKLRANGQVQMWEINGSSTATSLGTSTCTAFQNLTTTASASGSAVTSLSVSALTVALKVGHQFMLPNGQVATINAAAIVGATSVTIVSMPLTSTLASGSVLRPYVTAVLNVTPTTVNASRGDESGVAAISSANTAHRGGYFAASSTSFASPGAVSVHKATVT